MFDSEGTDMTYLLTQITSSKAIPIVSAILGIALHVRPAEDSSPHHKRQGEARFPPDRRCG